MGTKWLLIALPLIVFGVLVQSVFWVPTYDSQTRDNPQRSRTFLRAGVSDAKILNPIISSNAWAYEIMENKIFEALVGFDENLKLVGLLAERWQIAEDAYVAALPDRKLPDGNPATAAHVASLIEAAWKAGRLGGAELSVLGVELVPEETRARTESVLVADAKGKLSPVDVEMSIALPARVKIRLSKVESQLFEKLEAVLGANYFRDYPFAERFKLKKPEQMRLLREKMPELLGIAEHHPVITFFLRPGVRWHDGVPFSADDVKFTYDALLNPRNASPRASSYEPIESLEIVNPLALRVVYKRLHATALIDWAIGLLPKHLLDDSALQREMAKASLSKEARATFSIRNSEFGRHPIGTGPFRFSEWRPDQYIHLQRNDDYWGGKSEYRDLFYRVIPDVLTMELEFQAGALDWYDAQPHQAERYRKDPAYHLLDTRRGYYSYIAYNARRPLFQDARVRRALGMAIDVDSIIKYVLSGQGKRATGPYYSNTPFSDPTVPPLPYDPAAALALFAEVGWKRNSRGMLEKDGKPFQFTLVTNNGNAQRKAIMAIAQEAWRKLGIDCKIQAFEGTVFLEDFVHKLNFDAIILGWVGADMTPDRYQLWHSSQTGPYQLNYSGYKNPLVDQLIVRIRREYDSEAQVALTRQIHRLVAEDQPFTFLYEPTESVVLDKRIVRVERKEDGSEAFRRIGLTPTGDVKRHFREWRKLAVEPNDAP
ncbi:MAG TPA: ABC transporter substrate-binding protein [Polyangiaceae bacterium]|nr:ABC transporter substrate-binding protein [Polyangiaceae bacterium]